ncbi:MAG: hydantoinase/oxoprolinase N-terminal domain-containing protein [Rhodospirillales bacterium]
MAVLMGIDTGGTFTDAVLYDDEAGAVIASAKALTTPHDLAVGVGGAVERVMAESGAGGGAVRLVSLSTTLATNALVEGRRGRVCLVSIGHADADLARGGLMEALGDDPLIRISGGHDATGGEAAPLDEAALTAALDNLAPGAAGFAAAAMFATRNPAHEIRVRDIIRERTGLAVTCSHELSSKLDSPRRALTSVLNARLIGLITDLIEAAETRLKQSGINAPLMVVRGDGSMISAEVAKTRPIETILSGPAASVIGAAHLTGAKTAVAADIGGTTTDIAVITNGRPALDAEGATVGGWRTMVEAVAIRAVGLGGDSEIHLAERGMATVITLGPRRAQPIALTAAEHSDFTHGLLDAQLRRDVPSEHDARIALPLPIEPPAGLFGKYEQAVWDDLAGKPAAVETVAATRLRATALSRLSARGLVRISAVTPTDALHTLGQHTDWDTEAAEKALTLFARRRDWRGNNIAQDARAAAERIVEAVIEASAEAVLDAAFAHDGFAEGMARHPVTRRALEKTDGGEEPNLLDFKMALNAPVIALGAPAAAYYPAVGERLGARVIVPELAGVANAVGAAAGQIRIVSEITVTRPGGGAFRVHAPAGPSDYPDMEAALAAAETIARTDAETRAAKAGAGDVRAAVTRDVREVETAGQKLFVEALVTAAAHARPRLG